MRTYTLELTETELNQLSMTLRFGKQAAEKLMRDSPLKPVRDSWADAFKTLDNVIKTKIEPLELAAHHDRHAEANGVPFIGKDVENPSECECEDETESLRKFHDSLTWD
jgi:hypothetical protein